MKRRSFRSRFNGFRNRTRVIYKRARSRYRPQSFFKKHKGLVIIGLLALVGFFFKDRISALLVKK